jgi:hypothetical protein
VHAGDLRKDLLCSLALCLLAIANWTGRLAGPIDLRWDAGVYYTLGTSIYEGKGYRLLNEPGEIRAIQYPPLLPAIVALHQTITGTTDPFVVGHVMRWSWMTLYALYIPVVFWLAKRYLRQSLAVAVALITLLNPESTFLSDVAFAELPFALASVAFFLAYRDGRPVGSGIAFIAASVCFLLRTIGIALLGAWVLDSVRQRRFRSAAARAALAIVPVFAWSAYIHSVETSPEFRQPAYAYQRADYMFYNVSYAVNLKLKDPSHPAGGRATTLDMIGRVLRDLPRVIVGLAETVTSSRYYWDRQLERTQAWLPALGRTAAVSGALLCLAILILLGLVQVIRLECSMGLYIVLSLLAIAFAPWPRQYIRYLSPLAPYLAIALVLGLGMVSRLVPPKIAVRLTAIVICLIVVQQAISLSHCYRHDHAAVTEVTRSGQPIHFRLFYYTEAVRSLDAAQNWIMEQTGPKDVIAASMPHWLSLRTGRKAVMLPFGADLSSVERLLAEVPVDYVVLDEAKDVSLTSSVAPAIITSSAWRQVFAPGGGCRVFARFRSGSAASIP